MFDVWYNQWYIVNYNFSRVQRPPIIICDSNTNLYNKYFTLWCFKDFRCFFFHVKQPGSGKVVWLCFSRFSLSHCTNEYLALQLTVAISRTISVSYSCLVNRNFKPKEPYRYITVDRLLICFVNYTQDYWLTYSAVNWTRY